MFKISGIEFKRNIIGMGIACLIFVLFCVTIHQIGIFKYKDSLEEAEEFVNIESLKVKRYINYHQYAMFGLKILLRASPISTVFSNSTTFDGLYFFIDNSTRLKPGKYESGPAGLALVDDFMVDILDDDKIRLPSNLVQLDFGTAC